MSSGLTENVMLRLTPLAKRELETIGQVLGLRIAEVARLAAYYLIDQDKARRTDLEWRKELQLLVGHMPRRDAIVDAGAFYEGEPGNPLDAKE